MGAFFLGAKSFRVRSGTPPFMEPAHGRQMSPRPQPRSERYDVPEPFIDLARRRTEFLFRHMTYGDMPMRHILASAYLQGMNDCVEAMDKRGLLNPVSPPADSTE
jgi:hypothetical protein